MGQMEAKQIIDYYSKEGISEQIFNASKDKEVAGVYSDGSYGKRPDILQFKSEVLQMVKSGITSFHLSVERWSNPMMIKPENYEKLRIGWDLIIDIDSKIGIDEARIAAELIYRLFKKYGVKCGIKFSGRRGFHLCIPWESFPQEIDYKNLASLYPEIPRIIASFIREQIRDELSKKIQKDNPYQYVEIEKNWGARHMFRAPYSLNEKTWLVSLPLTKQELSTFSVEIAQPEIVETKQEFLISSEKNQVEYLVTDAMDWYALHKNVEKKETKRPNVELQKRISEEHFPPCIKLIFQGLSDFRKRSVFILINFLRTMNWSYEEIEERLIKWNAQNRPSLPRNYIVSQLRYSMRRELSCANCDSAFYFIDTGLCKPDKICKGGSDKITIVNPVNYPKKKLKIGKETLAYKCMDCGSKFKNMRSLNSHKNRHFA